MKKTIYAWITMLSAAALMLAGCSDDTTPPVDLGADDAAVDTGITDGQTNTDGPPANSRDTVMNSLTVPTSQADAEKYAFDYDNDGTQDNQLGKVLAAIAGAISGLDLQQQLNKQLYNGSVVMLLRPTAKDFANDTATTIQGWTGKETSCCTPAPPCTKAQADSSCFGGSFTFDIDTTSPTGSSLSGKIVSGQIEVGPGEAEVLLPIGNFPTKVKLKAARITGTIAADGTISDGVLTGAITKTELDANVVPSVAKVLNGELNEAGTAQAVKDAIKSVFDKDNDGQIATSEVADNALIKLLLAGDVDVDNDSVNEFSAGIGFTTVGCTINIP